MMSLSIGKLASKVGVSIDTVRYYERKQLLMPMSRTASGYRVYSLESVKQLRFVRKAQGLGFSLQEIKELLDLTLMPEKDCGDIRGRTQRKISEIEKKIDDLRAMQSALTKLADFCPGEGSPLEECSILKHFYEEE